MIKRLILAAAGFVPMAALSLVAQATPSIYPGQILYPGVVNDSTSTSSSDLINVVTADFNGDGLTDIAGGDADNAAAWVFLALKGGGFAKPVSYPTVQFPHSVAAADLDGDGAPDIVAGGLVTESVSVLLNNGDGTFKPRKDYDYGSDSTGTAGVAAGDLNGDGNVDVVTVSDSTNAYIIPGNGDGTLNVGAAKKLTSPANFYGGGGAAVADVNGDKLEDIVTVSGCDGSGFTGSNGAVNIFSSTVDGVLPTTLSQSITVGLCPQLATGDVNGDGIADIVVEQLYKNYTDAQNDVRHPSIQIILGGAGSLAVDASYPLPPASGGKPRIADVDGDGHPDLIISDSFAGTTVLYGVGDGSFESPVPVGATGDVTAFDASGDGLPDLVGIVVRDLTISRGLGKRHFLGYRRFTYEDATGAGIDARDITSADFNGDGAPDVATINDDGNLSLLINDGKGAFAAPMVAAVGTAPMQGLVAGDFNEDGKSDVAAVDNDGEFYVGIGNGDGTFTFTPGALAATGAADVAAGDINGDGHADLLFAENGGNQVQICTGGGQGVFGCDIYLPVTVSKPNRLMLADLNGDNRPDLIVTTATADPTVTGATDAYVWLNNGLGGFGTRPSATLPVAGGGVDIAAGDVNGDGIADLVFGSDGTDVTVFIGHGAGTLGAPMSWPAADPSYRSSTRPQYVALADVNGDGKTDIVAQNIDSRMYSVLINEGHGTFVAPMEFAAPNVPSTPLLTRDMDGDGLADITFAGGTYNSSAPGYTAPLVNTVNVYLHNHAPVAADIEASTAFETPYAGTLTATDTEGDTFTFAIATQPSHGKVVLTDAKAGTFTYTPANGFSGTDRFTFVASDALDSSAAATVKLTVGDDTTSPPDNGGGTHHGVGQTSGGGGAFGWLGLCLLGGFAIRRKHRG